ncbi:MAG: dihydroorotate dehydrogenase electron transfer subunit [Spirochaetota bacterium]|nr:dihydroorotate dehydrogenase electron transfer subunit [Spirochaetota bacterium]
MKGIILEKPEELCSDHYLLKIDSLSNISYPGQFVNIRISDQKDPLLRRPFSIHSHEKNIIEIVFKVIGKGTLLLKDYTVDQEIDIIAPLGNGFTITEDKKTLLIGGGVGNAPLYYLAKHLKIRNNYIHYLYGARTCDNIYLQKRYSDIVDRFDLSTDDGTAGIKGYITDILPEILNDEYFDIIYICGPLIMMSRIIEILRKSDIKVEASIERYFGCGVGFCYGCSVDTTMGLKRACIDGPVFDARVVNWDYLLGDL